MIDSSGFSETTLTSAAHNHQTCVNNALATAEQLCEQRGVQLTAIRQQVLALIWETHKAVKAYDLLDKIRPYQHSAKPATIYRALDFLIEQGLIHRVESLNAFVGCRCSGLQHEQLLLICKHCLEVEERTATQVMHAVSTECLSAEFVVSSQALEIHVTCKKCSAE